MSRSAIIQGENHLNRGDLERLLEETEQADVLYIEGRTDDDLISFWPPEYILFVCGALTIYLWYYIETKFRKITRREFNPEEEALERGLDTNSEIDVEVYEMFERVSVRDRILPLAVTSLLLSTGVYSVQGSTFRKIIPWILLIAVPFTYFSFMLVSVLPKDFRDQSMAKSVAEHATQNDHELRISSRWRLPRRWGYFVSGETRLGSHSSIQ